MKSIYLKKAIFIIVLLLAITNFCYAQPPPKNPAKLLY